MWNFYTRKAYLFKSWIDWLIKQEYSCLKSDQNRPMDRSSLRIEFVAFLQGLEREILATHWQLSTQTQPFRQSCIICLRRLRQATHSELWAAFGKLRSFSRQEGCCRDFEAWLLQITLFEPISPNINGCKINLFSTPFWPSSMYGLSWLSEESTTSSFWSHY